MVFKQKYFAVIDVKAVTVTAACKPRQFFFVETPYQPESLPQSVLLNAPKVP
jgi:hypothetical protein